MKLLNILIIFSLLNSLDAFGLPIRVKFEKEVLIRNGIKSFQYRLTNGLTVVLTPNPKAPLVSINHWVKAGSLHESKGITGIAHLFEHMMFRPLNPKSLGFFMHLSKLGGDANANTRFGSTFYSTTVPEDQLKQTLKLESDRFKTLKVTPLLLKVEKEAVRSEYSTKIDANPTADLWDAIYRSGFQNHPYGWTIIGFREDLDKITASDCNAFFSKYYRPNNVGLFISGNFNRSNVLSWIQAYYQDWKPGEDSKLPPSYQHANEFILANGKLKSTAKNILMGYRIPEYTSSNVRLINLSHFIFFDSDYNLAKRRIVDNLKLVSTVESFNFEYDSGMVKVFTSLFPNITFENVINEINKLPDDFLKLTDEEFDAYKNELRIALEERILRNENLNQTLALYWGKYGSIDYLSKEVRSINPIKRVEITELIKKYFIKNNMVAVINKDS